MGVPSPPRKIGSYAAARGLGFTLPGYQIPCPKGIQETIIWGIRKVRTLLMIFFAVTTLVAVLRTHLEARGIRVTRAHILITAAILAVGAGVVVLVLVR